MPRTVTRYNGASVTALAVLADVEPVEAWVARTDGAAIYRIVVEPGVEVVFHADGSTVETERLAVLDGHGGDRWARCDAPLAADLLRILVEVAQMRERAEQ